MGALARAQVGALPRFDPGTSLRNAHERLAVLAAHELAAALVGHCKDALTDEIRTLNAKCLRAILHGVFLDTSTRKLHR